MKHIFPILLCLFTAFYIHKNKKHLNFIYANEADVLNVALFGMTAKEWRESNLDLKGK